MPRRLGVAHATVVKAVARLEREELVVSPPCRGVFVTPRGRVLAEHCRGGTETMYEFPRITSIDEATVRHDAEGIEHDVSEEMLAAFRRMMTSAPQQPAWCFLTLQTGRQYYKQHPAPHKLAWILEICQKSRHDRGNGRPRAKGAVLI
jgi:Mn-dependent DtxR family transcriptional regulator